MLAAKTDLGAVRRSCVLIAAYDVSRITSEGHVAVSLLGRLGPDLRILLLTRRNNAAALRCDAAFRRDCANVHVLGIDLPRWAAWWKKGARFYGLYAYLWQLWWPLALRRRRVLERIGVVHVLNFHNDSIPSLAWTLGRPTVWGPVNHNEGVPTWRRTLWPLAKSVAQVAKTFGRRLFWRLDPLLWLTRRRVSVILSAGTWVDTRLQLTGRGGVVRRSQLGVPAAACRVDAIPRRGMPVRLLCAGRLDWIKGLDLAIEAFARLPETFTLTLVGDGPARERLVAYAREQGVGERVDFRPPMSRTALFRTLRDHDLLLFPSAEAAGLVWVEALANGLPVVTFAGHTEAAAMAGRLPGLYVAPDHGDRTRNVAAFAETIAVALAECLDPVAVTDAALARYRWESLAAELRAVYRSLGAP